MKNWKSRQHLVDDCEPIDCSIVIQLPTTPSVEHGKPEALTGDPLTAASSPSSKTSTHSFEPMEEDMAWIVHRRSTSVLWYKNWTYVGVGLCVIYNACIVFLLVLAYYTFIAKKSP